MSSRGAWSLWIPSTQGGGGSGDQRCRWRVEGRGLEEDSSPQIALGVSTEPGSSRLRLIDQVVCCIFDLTGGGGVNSDF